MSDLEQIKQTAQERSLSFLLIGGLAVIEHGFARITTDIDLVVRATSGQEWRAALEGLDYHLINERSNFQQYERPAARSWPLDLMLVNDATFGGLSASAVPVDIMGASIRMVSLNHLL